MPDPAPPLATVQVAFQARFGRNPSHVAWAPGRINVIGEHTDYNGGLALPAAIDRRVVAALAPRADRTCTLVSAAFGDAVTLAVDAPVAPRSSWQRYALGCLAVLREKHPLPQGFDLLLAGDVPIGAGLSSSAATTVSVMNGLRATFRLPVSDLDLVRLCQRVEHEHLGVRTGLLDQVASQFARADHALLVDFQALAHATLPEEAIRPIPARIPGHTWVVVDSGVRRELARSAYDDRVRECQEGLAAVRARDPGVRHLRDVTTDHLHHADASAGVRWPARLRHVLEENARVLEAARALEAGDAPALGRLLVRSHASLRDLYEVSCPELDTLVALALEVDACLGARMVGGGFGGCVLALVASSRVGTFEAHVLSGYERTWGRTARAFGFQLTSGAGAEPR